MFQSNLLIATGLLGVFLNNVPDGFFAVAGKKAYLQIFMTVVVIGWILVAALSCIFIIGLHEKFPAINWVLCVAIVSATWAVLLLISSVLLAIAIAHYHEKEITTSYHEIVFHGSICDYLHRRKVTSECADLIAGVGCGMFAMVLFVVDAIIHFVYFKLPVGSTAAEPQTSGSDVD